MGDSYKTVSNISYGKNIKNSLAGAVIGFIFFVLSFAVLWFNEGHSVKQINIADYVVKNAVEVSSAQIDRKNDNTLIVTSGKATTSERLSDEILSVSNVLALSRKAEMYQWDEEKHTESKDNVGGSTTQTTTYNYVKKWSESEINSADFYDKSHYNPPFKIKSERLNAMTGNLGAFSITETQTKAITNLKRCITLPPKPGLKLYDNYYYTGKNINNPEIGDMRISYSYVPSGTEITVIGEQKTNNTIVPLYTKNGSVYIQYNGLMTKAEAIEKFKHDNAVLTNILRFVGWLLMFLGLSLLIKPLSTVLKFLPFLESVAEFIGTGIVFAISLILSFITIAIAWFAYRPVLSVCLIVFAILIILFVKIASDKKSAALQLNINKAENLSKNK